MAAAGCMACGAQTNAPSRFDFPRWGPTLRGAAMHQTDAGIEGGGGMAVDRWYGEVGLARMWALDRLFSLSIGQGVDRYRFSGNGPQPWGNVGNLRAGLFCRWGFDNGWTAFAAPSFRWAWEEGADLGKARSPALFGGASYRLGDRLELGPGLGIVGRIKDDPRFFPVLVVDWRITDRLRLETGGGLAATAGPGLSLGYGLAPHWTVALAGRYESRRFRLAGDNAVPDGIGEEKGFSLVSDIVYSPYPGGSAGFFIGYNMNNSLAVYDAGGKTTFQSDVDPGLMTGIFIRLRY